MMHKWIVERYKDGEMISCVLLMFLETLFAIPTVHLRSRNKELHKRAPRKHMTKGVS
jgi:hypothetical protein